MAAKIHLEIVTPEGVKFSEDVDEFTAPGVSGEFGVLPSHRPLLAGIKTGILSYQIGDESSQVAVGPGFARVREDEANIITDHFMAKSDVDPVVARKDLKEAQQLLDAHDAELSETEKKERIGASRWAAVRLELYGDAPPATVILAHELQLLGHDDYSKPSGDEGANSAPSELTDDTETVAQG